MKILGSVKTSVYIYMVPVITAVTSALILHEKLTMTIILGIVLTLIGLFYPRTEKQRNIAKAKEYIKYMQAQKRMINASWYWTRPASGHSGKHSGNHGNHLGKTHP